MKKFVLIGMLAMGAYFGYLPESFTYWWDDEEFDHLEAVPGKTQVDIVCCFDSDVLQED